MAVGNRLFALAEREFRKNRTTPVRQSFRGMKLNVGKFDESWDRHRGAAVRMMSVVLRDDDASLRDRVCESPQTTKAYADATDWFTREAAVLRKTASLLETAAERLNTVLAKPCDRIAP